MEDWISATPNLGIGSGNVDISVSKNEGEARSSSIKVSSIVPRVNIEKTISIDQQSGEFTLTLILPRPSGYPDYYYGYVSAYALNGKVQPDREITIKDGDVLSINYVCEYKSQYDSSKNEEEVVSLDYNGRHNTVYKPKASSEVLEGMMESYMKDLNKILLKYTKNQVLLKVLVFNTLI